MIDINEMSVLIADDAITMCKAIKNMMRIIGYGRDFLYANNGEDTLKILRKKPIDFVTLDYHMPGKNGAEVLNEIRRDRNLRDLPVIMITGAVYQDYVAEVAESEIDAYILKPLTAMALEEKISRIIEKANNPPPMVYHLKKAIRFDEEGNIVAALKEAGLAMDANPNSSRPIRELGYYYFKNDRFKEAEKWLLKAAKMNYMDVFAFHYLGELYLKINDMEKAHYYFEKAMKISPRHLTRGINFGKTLIKKKMFTKAIQVFSDIIKLSRNNLELREDIADFCIDKEGASDFAVKLIETILRENRKRTDMFFKLGKALETSGDIKTAIPYLVKASDIDEENIEIKIHLAKDYLIMGKPIFAENVLKKAIKLKPSHREARELLKQCD